MLLQEEQKRMALIKTKKGYLIFAIVSFVLSAYGFAGMIDGRGGRHPSPIYFGVLLFICCLFFSYCFLKAQYQKKYKMSFSNFFLGVLSILGGLDFYKSQWSFKYEQPVSKLGAIALLIFGIFLLISELNRYITSRKNEKL